MKVIKTPIKFPYLSTCILFMVIFLMNSCTSEQNNDAKNNTTTDSSSVTSSNVQEMDTLMDDNNTVTMEVFDIDACKSPAGLSIVFWGPSDIEGQYYFLEDHRVVNRFYNEFALVGTWSMEDQLITIVYDTKYYRKGVGESIPIEGGVPGNYIPQFEQYEYLTQEVLETEIYFWDEIIQEIKEETGFYELVSHDLDNTIFPNLINLQSDID